MSTRSGAPTRVNHPTSVATEALLLCPRGGSKDAADDAALWPVFVLVVNPPVDPTAVTAKPLFELLDRSKHDNELTVATARADWSVVDPASALLALAVRATAPVPFELRVLVPSAQVLGLLDVVAKGATIGLTTPRGAGRLRGRVDSRTALRDVVLLGHVPSTELAALARTLLATRARY